MNHFPARKVLFVHNYRTHFVEIDLKLLSGAYHVTEIDLKSVWEASPARLRALVASHDLVFVWFASWYAFLPVLLSKCYGKPAVVVVGGYDLAALPEIGYGHQRGGLKKWVSRWVMGGASKLIAISNFSRGEAVRNVGVPKDKVRVIHLGVADPFGCLPDSAHRTGVLSVGNIDRSNLLRKGHLAFVQSAHHNPSLHFTLVGAWRDDAIERLRSASSANTTFTGWVERDRLLDHYRTASVYVQASIHEGFGLSVAEAMLGGCIPVVTAVGALPEVVGEAGIYIPAQDPRLVAEAVARAHRMPDRRRQLARERVLDCFPLERRRVSLVETVEQVFKT